MSDLEDYNNIIVDIPHMREIYNSFESERNKFTCAISDLESERRMNYVTKKFEWVHKDTISQQLKEIDKVLPIDLYDITSEEYEYIHRSLMWRSRDRGVMKRACYIDNQVFTDRANVIYANYKRVLSETNFKRDNITITIYGHKYTFKKPWRS